MGYYIRNGYRHYRNDYVRHKRNPEYERKSSDYIKVNDKLKMIGILFTAAFRASKQKGISYKHLRIYLYENPQNKDWRDPNKHERVYLDICMDNYRFKKSGEIRKSYIRKMGKRKSQIVKV